MTFHRTLCHTFQIFTVTFFIEMLLKLTAYTPRGYVQNSWNIFDGFLVIVSTVDLLLSKTGAVSGNTLSVLRVFRLVSIDFVIGNCHLINRLVRKNFIFSGLILGKTALGRVTYSYTKGVLYTGQCLYNLFVYTSSYIRE